MITRLPSTSSTGKKIGRAQGSGIACKDEARPVVGIASRPLRFILVRDYLIAYTKTSLLGRGDARRA